MWQLRAANGTDPVSGKRREVVETYRGSKAEAGKRLAAIVTEIEDGHLTGPSRIKLEALIDEWRAQAHHELGTARRYDRAQATIPAHLMSTPIHKITAAAIRSLLATVQAEHGVHRAIAVHTVISGGLTHAWRMEYLKQNQARKVPVPTAKRRKATAPDPDAIRQIMDEVAKEPQFFAWLMVASDAGSRRGETSALRWSEVNLDRGDIRIFEALDPIDGHVKGTKTEDDRTVALTDSTVAALRDWRKLSEERASAARVNICADPFVFSFSLDHSEPWTPWYPTSRFGKIRQRAGLATGKGQIRLYDLRHHVATELLDAGVPVKVVAGRLGHSRTQTTEDTYGHVKPSSDRASADILEQRRAKKP